MRYISILTLLFFCACGSNAVGPSSDATNDSIYSHGWQAKAHRNVGNNTYYSPDTANMIPAQIKIIRLDSILFASIITNKTTGINVGINADGVYTGSIDNGDGADLFFSKGKDTIVIIETLPDPTPHYICQVTKVWK